MTGLVRYIILPLGLWWLLTGGYRLFLTGQETAPIPREAEPGESLKRTEPPARIADLAEPPRVPVEQTPKPNVRQTPTPSPSSLAAPTQHAACAGLKEKLLASELQGARIDASTVRTGMQCDLSKAQKRSILKHALNHFESQLMHANALEIISIYKAHFTDDPYPHFSEASIKQRLGEPNQAIAAFLKGYQMSEIKPDIEPSHFLVALKSMQELQLVCEQIEIMRAMTALNRLDARSRQMLTNQINTLNAQCGT